MDNCPLLFFGANEIVSVHVYGKKKKLMTEMDYQGHTCTTMVGVDHVYFVMPNQLYSQLQNKYLQCG
jgi:hypothetical protein